MTRRTWTYDLALLLVILIWGANFPVVKGALRHIPPFPFNAARFTLSTLLMALPFYYRWRTRTHRKTFLRQYLWKILGLGAIGHALYQVCFILGLNFTTAGNAALIMASAPLWTALIGQLTRAERLPPLGWVGLFISMTGTVLVVLLGPTDISFGAHSLLGNLIMLVGALAWGTYTAMSRPLLREVTPSELTFLSMIVAPPLLWLLAFPALPEVLHTPPPSWVWLALLYSGLFATGLAYILWNMAIKHVGASNTAVSGNLVPFVALLISHVALGEPVTLLQLLSGGLIVGGLLLMRWVRHQTPTTS